ncbi:hypothetical protein [Minwuia sp.]|uniref:hypothetical protein n=1 Tax=Minwuia sp. TaxID=2493630 RepID=UPI003A8F2B06
MGHTITFILVPPGQPYSHKITEEGFDIYSVISDYSEGPHLHGHDYEELLLTNSAPPEVPEDEMLRWKMTQRQVRLEFRLEDEALSAELGPETSLERLADLRNERAVFHGERYWVEGEYVCAESPINPNPRYDWGGLGGQFASDFADPPPWEREIVTELCSRCKGKGEIPGKTYLLPRPLRLTKEARNDPGNPRTCAICMGEGSFSYPERLKDVPDQQMIKTIPDVLARIEWSESCWPSSLVDLNGVWHGPPANYIYGVPEEETPEEILENSVLKFLREAPEGTRVAVADMHYA